MLSFLSIVRLLHGGIHPLSGGRSGGQNNRERILRTTIVFQCQAPATTLKRGRCEGFPQSNMCIPWAEVFPFFLTGYGPRFRRPLSASVLVSQASWLAQGTARRAEVRGATAVGTKRGTFTGYGTFTGTARSAEVQGAGPSQGQQTQGLGRVRKDFVLVNTLARGKDLARTPDKLGQTSGHDSVSLAEPWASTSGQASLTSERRHSLATKRAGPSAWGFPEKADFRRGASPFVRRRVTPPFCIGLCTKGRTDTLQLLKERKKQLF